MYYKGMTYECFVLYNTGSLCRTVVGYQGLLQSNFQGKINVITSEKSKSEKVQLLCQPNQLYSSSWIQNRTNMAGHLISDLCASSLCCCEREKKRQTERKWRLLHAPQSLHLIRLSMTGFSRSPWGSWWARERAKEKGWTACRMGSAASKIALN